MLFQQSVVWATGTSITAGRSPILEMQISGSLLLRDNEGEVLWTINTDGKGERLQLTGLGKLNIKDKNKEELWTSH